MSFHQKIERLDFFIWFGEGVFFEVYYLTAYPFLTFYCSSPTRVDRSSFSTFLFISIIASSHPSTPNLPRF